MKRSHQVIITATIYIIYLLIGSVIFQSLEKSSKEARCIRKKVFIFTVYISYSPYTIFETNLIRH